MSIASDYGVPVADVLSFPDGTASCGGEDVSPGTRLTVCDYSRDERTVMVYLGAYPQGIGAPDLSTIPYAVNVIALTPVISPLYDGTFVPNWDVTSDDPLLLRFIEQNKVGCGGGVLSTARFWFSAQL